MKKPGINLTKESETNESNKSILIICFIFIRRKLFSWIFFLLCKQFMLLSVSKCWYIYGRMWRVNEKVKVWSDILQSNTMVLAPASRQCTNIQCSQWFLPNNIILMHYSLYLPDHASCDFFLILKLKIKLKKHRFHTTKKIQWTCLETSRGTSMWSLPSL